MAKIIVRGRGAFPVDMLRFMEAWPAEAESVARIHNSIGREQIGADKRATQHLLNRWPSFGWNAYVIGDDGTVLLTTDKTQPLGEEPLTRPCRETRARRLDPRMVRWSNEKLDKELFAASPHDGSRECVEWLAALEAERDRRQGIDSLERADRCGLDPAALAAARKWGDRLGEQIADDTQDGLDHGRM